MKIKLLVTAVSLFAVTTISFSAKPLSPPETPSVSQTVIKNTSGQINLNTANVEMLTKSIKGIGEKRAEAIIKYRDAHGGFKTIDELSQVPGLGKKFVVSHLDVLQQAFMIESKI